MSHIWIIYKHGGLGSNFTQFLRKTVFMQVLTCSTSWKGCTLRILTFLHWFMQCPSSESRHNAFLSFAAAAAAATSQVSTDSVLFTLLVTRQTSNCFAFIWQRHLFVEYIYIFTLYFFSYSLSFPFSFDIHKLSENLLIALFPLFVGLFTLFLPCTLYSAVRFACASH